jgi:outer membrane protein OmpA-like peptidoglycan-associated protein
MSISRTSRRQWERQPANPSLRWIPRVATLSAILSAGLLTGCGDFLANIPERPAASDDAAVAETPYPSLGSVPARPQLTYTLEQRREIAEGLVADRANARYAGDTVRQELDRPVQPDTAPPLPPAPVAPTEPAADPEADLAAAYVEEALARDADDGSLGDFLERLERRPPASAEARPVPPPPAAAPQAEPPAAERLAAGVPAGASEAGESVAAEPLTPGDDQDLASTPAVEATEPVGEPAASTGDMPPTEGAGAEVALAPAAPSDAQASTTLAPAPIGDAIEKPVAAEPREPSSEATTTGGLEPERQPVAASAPPSEPRLPLSLVFEPDAVEVGDGARAELQVLAAGLNGTGDPATVVVSGGGERAGLAMERARRVAALLVTAGLPPARIAIEMGGESDVVVVYEAGS